MGIDVTISSAQCHPTIPESVSFYSAQKGKEFCYRLFSCTVLKYTNVCGKLLTFSK